MKRLKNGKLRVVMDIDTDLHPVQSRAIESQPWGTRTAYVMRQMAVARQLSVETKRHNEIIDGISRNTEMLCQILQRLSEGTISMQEVEEQINSTVEEGRKTLNKLSSMAVKRI
jgi:hypothetical protein